MTVPFAHAGHWLVKLLYLAPLALLTVILGWSRLQQRRGNRPTRDGDDRAHGQALEDILDEGDQRLSD